MEPTEPSEIVRRGYDAVSYAYRADDADDGHYRDWLERLCRRLRPGAAVLDLGCGCGVPVSRWLAGAGYTVTGVDFSRVQVRRARRLVPGATFVEGDVTAVRFPAGTFDRVVCLFTLIHLPLREQPALLRRIADWLRPDGLLLATAGRTAWTGCEDDWHGAPMWWSHAEAATYREWLAAAGLRVDSEEMFCEDDGSGHAVFWATRPGHGATVRPIDPRVR